MRLARDRAVGCRGSSPSWARIFCMTSYPRIDSGAVGLPRSRRSTGKNGPEPPFDGRRSAPTPLLVFCVSRFPLMPDRQDQHDILGRQPAILCDVAVLPTGQHEFTSTILRYPTQQRMICQDFESWPYARDLRQRPTGIDVGNEIEQALQIAERPGAYFDARHERARGRRGFLPATLSAKYSNVAAREWALPLPSASPSDSAASAANRCRSSDRSASRASASTMNA